MTSSLKHVGLDVHQASTVVAVRNDGGRVIARTILPTEAMPLIEFFRGLRGTIHVALEEGTQAQWLHDLLAPMVARVVVCDRRGQGGTGSKGDRLDAEELADLLRLGALRPVYHGGASRATLRELARCYQSLVDDSTRVMLRLKALFRARGLKTAGRMVYQPREQPAWLRQLADPGARFRAQALYAELEVLQRLRPTAKAALLREARRDPAWDVLQTVPFFGPVRVALLLSILQTPWRFRTKRQLWAYAGLAVVTRTSAEYQFDRGRPVRRPRLPMTRGLNRNHHPALKNVLKGAATAAATRPGPLQDFYQAMLRRGMRPELARVTLARKLAAILLHLWKTGDTYDPHQLTLQAD